MLEVIDDPVVRAPIPDTTWPTPKDSKLPVTETVTELPPTVAPCDEESCIPLG